MRAPTFGRRGADFLLGRRRMIFLPMVTFGRLGSCSWQKCRYKAAPSRFFLVLTQQWSTEHVFFMRRETLRRDFSSNPVTVVPSAAGLGAWETRQPCGSPKSEDRERGEGNWERGRAENRVDAENTPVLVLPTLTFSRRREAIRVCCQRRM